MRLQPHGYLFDLSVGNHNTLNKTAMLPVITILHIFCLLTHALVFMSAAQVEGNCEIKHVSPRIVLCHSGG